VLPGFIPEGATLLVSRPKLGKSWFVLDLCIAIAAGSTTLGALQPATGDVLYLALEDGARRLQRRMAALLRHADAWPSRLALATQWNSANAGGLDDIRAWCLSVPKPVAVVIDTLERFRGRHGIQNSSHHFYYDAVAQLQRIAIEHGISVIIVHHERKASANDPFDTIAGTLGLTGAADTMLILKREERGTVLYVRGRDVEDSETLMVFDRERCKWILCGPAAPSMSGERAAIVALLSQADAPVKVNDIVAATGRNRGAVDTLLHKMVADGEIERVMPGRYACKTSKTVRSRVTI
jgi:RecA-family ATPase